MASQADSLLFHRAKKKTPCLDANGKSVEPTSPNSVKFERFIFDLLPSAKNAVVQEVEPAEAFAPVKNAKHEKTDTAATSQAAMMALHRRWLREVGVVIEDETPVEISAGFAFSMRMIFAGRWRRGRRSVRRI